MSGPKGWQGILDEGETILWQGRPDRKINFRIGNLFTFLFGLAFAGFALFWMIGASMSGGYFWMFGLLHFAVGVGLSFGAVFWNTIRRSFTWYTLTDRRAFIATSLPHKGKVLRSFPISKETVLDFRQGPPDTIYFDTETRRGNKGSHYSVDVGFERIDEGEKVYRLMRQVQKGTDE